MMIKEINREQVDNLIKTGATLVDVLSAQAYQEEHIRGAISLPLEDLDEAAIQKLDRSRPVIVYCHDYD